MSSEQVQTIGEKLEATLLAGKLLMENGAELRRIETTLSHLAKALQIDSFEAFVMNRGVFVSGENSAGFAESRVVTTKETVINLRKLEEVNLLSRQVVQGQYRTPQEIISVLETIDSKKDYSLMTLLIAYFIGAGAFALALGSVWGDALSSAITGLLIGVVYHYLSRLVTTKFLLTIIGSAVAVFWVNLMVILGFGEHRSLILLGAFMVLIPGAFFVNAIRELSQNNYVTGLALLINALLVCLSIAVGVAVCLEIIPFADQMTGTFSSELPSLLGMLYRSLSAGFGTVAFAALYSVNKRFFLDLGILGTLTWFIYLFVLKASHNLVLAVLIPSLLVAFASKGLAIYRKSPETIFLATSLFPLIPGISFYQGVYFMLTGSSATAETSFRTSFITAFTIATAIAISQQFSLRKWLEKRKLK